LIESLRQLVRQATETLGPDAPSTLMLQQQLDSAIAAQKPKNVFWLQPAASDAAKDQDRDAGS
jgi:hypothetical protein